MSALKKILSVGIITLIFASTTACENKSTPPKNITAPVIETSDNKKITLPCTGAYSISLNNVNNEYAKKLCSIADKELSENSLNSIWFGENIYGLGLASVVYFGKYAEKLTDEEWECLCDIVKAPDKYTGIFSSEASSGNNELLDSHASMASRIPDSTYFDAMIENIVNDYSRQKNCSRAEAFEFIYSDGVTIKTPYSTEIQNIVNTVYSNPDNFTSNGDASFPQSAFVILDYNGGAAAIAGGNNGNTAYNRASKTLHKIGSTIKPIAVYTPALQNHIINFSSLVPDEPLRLGNGENTVLWPDNYNDLYEGDITVTYALRQSKNTCAVQLAERIGAPVCFDFLNKNLGFTTLTDNDISDSAMAMGYLDRGVTLTELAAAYEIYGNGGFYYAPHFYTEVIDHNGNTVLKCDPQAQNVIDSQTAWIMNRLLYYNVSMPNGIAGAAQLENGVETIGKTGTVDNSAGEDTDKLFVGATPEYTAAVWVGFDSDGSTIGNLSYTAPAEIWKNIMEQIPCEKKSFDADAEVITAEYCTSSGCLAGENCFDTEIGYYTRDNIPGICSVH